LTSTSSSSLQLAGLDELGDVVVGVETLARRQPFADLDGHGRALVGTGSLAFSPFCTGAGSYQFGSFPGACAGDRQ
jgi:hypothetical protein